MTLTRSEQQLLHDIDNKLVLLTERQDKQLETQDRLKLEVGGLKRTVYENGLNSRVKELHEWMLEQKMQKVRDDKAQAQDDQQEHEIKLLGVKMSAELKGQIITGLIAGTMTIIGVVISK